MKTRGYVWGPVLFAAVFAAIGLAAGEGGVSLVLRVQNEAGKVLCAAGCFAAASAFERGDYMRRAWACTGGCLLLLLVRDVTLVPAVSGALAWAHPDAARGAVVVVANASSVFGAWLMARASTVAGLDEDDGRAPRKAFVLAGGLAAALLVTGWPLQDDVRRLLSGDLQAIPWLGSDLGDALTFALIAPILQTALALRGGALAAPWALLTSGGFCWILYDAGWGFSELFHVEGDPRVRIAIDAMRALACALIAAGGLAQRRLCLQAVEEDAPAVASPVV